MWKKNYSLNILQKKQENDSLHPQLNMCTLVWRENGIHILFLNFWWHHSSYWTSIHELERLHKTFISLRIYTSEVLSKTKFETEYLNVIYNSIETKLATYNCFHCWIIWQLLSLLIISLILSLSCQWNTNVIQLCLVLSRTKESEDEKKPEINLQK